MYNACQVNEACDSAACCTHKGALSVKRGSYREACCYLLVAIIRQPACWPAFYKLGNVWAALNNMDAALWAYGQATGYCDSFAPLFLNMGLLHCRLGNYQKALPYLKQAWRLEQNPESQAALAYAWQQVYYNQIYSAKRCD